MIQRIIFLILIFWLAVATGSKAEGGPNPAEIRYTVSGTITDATTGEALIGATVLVEELKSGTATNVYGYYSISLNPATYRLVFSYIGYQPLSREVSLDKNYRFDIALAPQSQQLTVVEITGDKAGDHIRKAEMGIVKMDNRTINRIPALMGETDIIRVMQLLPGVKMVAEGSTGFSVRGGAPDQNLILLDEAQVYNAAHMLGFFSIFNNDAIKDVKIFKGDIPASSGGRLSSMLDIRMKDGNSKRFSGSGGIGLISSRLMLEGPLASEQTTFLLAGRRTYADVFLPLSSDKQIRDNTLYFYDFNAKVSHRFNENNRLFVSGYFGRDVFENQFGGMDFGNQTFTLRWNHLFSAKLFANFTGTYSNYDYFIGSPAEQANAFEWKSKMRDHSLKFDFTYFATPAHTLRFGAQSTFHVFDPGAARGIGSETSFNELVMPVQYSLESAVYAGNDHQITPLLSAKYGLRFSAFNNIGPATDYRYDELYQPYDSVIRENGRFYHTYMNLEPRIGLNYILDEVSSLKASYSRTVQYIQLAQNSTAGTPLDIWFAATPNVKPQRADIFAVGYFRNLARNTIQASVELYYKHMENSIDFKDQADLIFNEYLEGELRTGYSRAYGLELLLRKTQGVLNGWVGYTWSRARRYIDAINEGKPYSPPYDKPHEISIVMNYEMSPRVAVSANWVYATGNPVTFPTGRAVIGNNIVPVYSDRNAYRMPDYHRLDVSLILKPRPNPNRKFNYEWNFSLYNAYGRKNAWSINFRQDKENPQVTYAEKTYLFGIVPSVTFNFSF